MGPVIPKDSINPQDIKDYLTRSHAAASAGWTHSEEVVDEQKKGEDDDTGRRSKLYTPVVADTPLSLYLSSKLKK